MAVTGVIAFSYVVAHMLGNLQVFVGPDQINGYAAFLKSNPKLLWIARIILIVAIIMHIVAAYQLARMSQKSRPVKYSRWKPVGSDYASRTMRWSGPIIGLFIIYHLLHMTTGDVHPNFHEADVYSNIIIGFKVWYVSLFYIIAMLALSLHMYHGVWSMFESVGVSHPRYNKMLRGFATTITVVVIVGFISIPIAVMLGLLS